MPRRRGKTTIGCRVPIETWQNITMHMADKPEKVLMLLCAVKGLTLSDNWWEALFKNTKQDKSRKSRFMYEFAQYYKINRACQYKDLFRLIYGMFCNQCGCRYHHDFFPLYNMRICNECYRENHISNVVLWKDYGIGLEEIGLKYINFIRYIAARSYTNKRDLYKITRDDRDFEAIKNKLFIFFWLPDIKRFFDLSKRAKTQRKKIQAVNLLKACFQRKYVSSISKRYFLENIHENEAKRILFSCTDVPFTYGTNFRLGNVLKKGRQAKPKQPDFNIQLAFQQQPKIPLLGDKEYTIRTMAYKFNLNKSEAISKMETLVSESGSLELALNKIFVVD